MQIHDSMEKLPDISHPVVTVGSFDGVHAGHRVIIRRLNDLAEESGGESVLITFHPHPRLVLYPDSSGKDLKLITTPVEKAILMEEAGLDHLVIMKFTKEFSRITSTRFIHDFLVDRLHAHTIVVGFNHYFGYNKEGSFDSLYRVKEQYGFRVEEIPEQEIQHETVSSTKIRKALNEGNIQRANAYLEHHYRISARIRSEYSPIPDMEGHDSFRLQIEDPYKLVPPDGRYAVSVRMGDSHQKGLIWITEGIIRLFHLESVPEDSETERTIYFHKHLNRAGDAPDSGTPLRNDLERVKELIY